MIWEAWFTLGVVLLLINFLIFSQKSPDLILLGGLTLLLVFGILDSNEALVGLSNQGVVTIGVLYIVVAGLQESGSISRMIPLIFGRSKSLFFMKLRFMPLVTVLSAFMNNTPVVAMLIPAIKEIARKSKFSPSQLLIPLSYASIFGGTCSLIGTSTNLVVYGLLSQQRPDIELGLFEIAWVGIPCSLLGLAYMLFIGRYLLPDRETASYAFQDPREYTVEMIVEPESPLVGKTIEDAGLRNLPGMFLVEIDREGRIIPAVSPQEKLAAHDRLIFAGVVESIVDLQKIRGLVPATDQVFKLDSPRSERILIEAVVSNKCHLIGRSIREGKFRSTYNAVVLAVTRHGERIKKKVGDIVLQPADTLLLEAHPSFFEQQRNSRDFFLMSRIENSNPPRHEKSIIAISILLTMVFSVSVFGLSMLKAAMLAAGLMILTRCCSVSVARKSVDWQVLLTIAASFGIGHAIDKTGLAEVIAGNLISFAGGNPWITLGVIYLLTTCFTEMITNNAAAVLVFPIALATSMKMDMNFLPFAITIMMAASASFSSPIGYQTNLMVYGPGGYRFTDYLRVGLPLNIMLGITTVILAPRIWGF